LPNPFRIDVKNGSRLSKDYREEQHYVKNNIMYGRYSGRSAVDPSLIMMIGNLLLRGSCQGINGSLKLAALPGQHRSLRFERMHTRQNARMLNFKERTNRIRIADFSKSTDRHNTQITKLYHRCMRIAFHGDPDVDDIILEPGRKTP